MKKGLYIALIVLLVAAIGASALYLGSYFLESKREADRYNELSSIVESAKETSPYYAAGGEIVEPTVELDLEPENIPARPKLVSGEDFLPWYTELHNQNSDMIGWLKIEGTKIDYPVMQSSKDNPNYYLYRNFDKAENARGSIYIREECDAFRPSDNITIFGHNMKDGSMFGSLSAYTKEETWKENSLIFFDTLTESNVYKIFAAFKTSANEGMGFEYHLMVDAKDEAEFNAFVETCKKMSMYDTGITPIYGDKIICLSTCEYTLDNGRFVVAAVKIT